MSDRRPDRVYGLLVRNGRVFVLATPAGPTLPGGHFPPLAEDRKAQLAAHLYDQLGIEARTIWAQGAFDYRDAREQAPEFSGFYSVWEFDGEVAPDRGEWLDEAGVAAAGLDPRLKILLASLLDTRAMRTT